MASELRQAALEAEAAVATLLAKAERNRALWDEDRRTLEAAKTLAHRLSGR